MRGLVVHSRPRGSLPPGWGHLGWGHLGRPGPTLAPVPARVLEEASAERVRVRVCEACVELPPKGSIISQAKQPAVTSDLWGPSISRQHWRSRGSAHR